MASEFTLCPVCGKMFLEPVTLNCFHTFCFNCLNKASGNFVCTICNQKHDVTNEIDRDNFTQTFCDVIRMERKLRDVCISCADNTAGMYCFDCQNSYCSNCSTHHISLNHHEHEVVPFTSVLERGFERRKSTPLTCDVHDLNVNQFCMTCQKLVCGECVISEHRGHWCLPTDKALTQSAGTIKKTSKTLKNFHTEYHRQNLLVLEYLEVEKDKIKKEIKNLFAEIREMLDRKERRFIQDVENVFEKEKKYFKEIEIESSKMCSTAAAASTRLKFINKYGTAREMLDYHSRLKMSKLVAYLAAPVQLLPKAVVHQSSSLISEIDSLVERLNCVISRHRGDYVKRLLNR